MSLTQTGHGGLASPAATWRKPDEDLRISRALQVMSHASDATDALFKLGQLLLQLLGAVAYPTGKALVMFFGMRF